MKLLYPTFSNLRPYGHCPDCGVAFHRNMATSDVCPVCFLLHNLIQREEDPVDPPHPPGPTTDEETEAGQNPMTVKKLPGQNPLTVKELLDFFRSYVEIGIGDDPVFFTAPGLRDHAVEAIGYESIQGARGVVLREFTSQERIDESPQRSGTPPSGSEETDPLWAAN